MKKIVLALAVFFSMSSLAHAAPETEVKQSIETFYSEYMQQLKKDAKDDQNPDQTLIDWVTANTHVSADFKRILKETLLKARQDDPEMGLGSDPIIDAQDFPDKGYLAKDIKVEANKASVVMEGIEAPDFKIQVDAVLIDGKWLVNGIGGMNRSEN